MPLKIGIDVRMIQHSGIGVRIQNILRLLPNTKEFSFYLFGDPEIISQFSIPKNATIVPYFAKIYSIREWFGHPVMKEMDILDIPHFNIPIRYIRKCIVTIHDLIPLVMKQYHASFLKRIYLHFILQIIKQKARKIVTVSDYTRSDFIKYIGKPQGQIELIYNGINSEIYKVQPKKKIEEFKKKYSLPKSYFLSVGIGKGHKNFSFLIQNLSDLWKQNKIPESLVIAGAYQFKVEFETLLSMEQRSKVILLPRIPEEEMPIMYQSALALVYPSLYEGFGFPVVEAQSVGCPVLSSDATVLPEILGKSAFFFNAKSSESFQNTVLSFQKLKATTLSKMLTQGKNNAKRFQWAFAVEKILVLYKEVS